MNCKNCHTEFEGNYCNYCGQPAKPERLDWLYLRHSIQHSVFHLDMRMLFTAKQFFLYPGKAAKDFFSGKRIKYASPFAYFALATTIYILLNNFLSVENIQQDEITKKLTEYQEKISLFIIIPSYVFFTKLLFRRNGYNNYELFTFHCYLQVQFMLIELVIAFIDWSLVHFYIFLHPYTIYALKLGSEILFMGWAFMQLFDKKNIWPCFAKALLMTVLGILIWAILTVMTLLILRI
jgi:hypothetical protein